MTKQSVFSSILFDRDGTLIVDKHYLSDPQGVELLPGAGQAVADVIHMGRKCYLVSNQSGVGRGMFSFSAAQACNEQTAFLIKEKGGEFVDMLFCPHAPEENCSCRKPAIGMWETLQSRHGLLPEHTLMVGDKIDDLLFASNAGMQAAALVLTGKGKKTASFLGLSLSGQYVLYPDETRPEYPQIFLQDCRFLVAAIKEFEQLFQGT